MALQAEELAAAKGIALPADFLQVAAKEGLRLSVLTKFFELQVFDGIRHIVLSKTLVIMFWALGEPAFCYQRY